MMRSWRELGRGILFGAMLLATLVALPHAEAAVFQARIFVTEPYGNVWTIDFSVANYSVAVTASSDIVFSANWTTVTNGNASTANYSWDWGDGGPGSDGIWVVRRFSGAGLHDVNLTVREAGTGNLSWSEVHVIVDAESPTVLATANLSGSIEEDVPIHFNASGSDETGIPGVPGWIAYWAWDFDSDGWADGYGREIEHSFETPGHYVPTAWTVDWVLRRSVNMTLPDFMVLDTTPPTIPGLTVVHEGDWGTELGAVSEDTVSWFSAPEAVDNYDPIQNLTFSWSFEDVAGGIDTRAGANVSYSWSEPSTSYVVTLNVTDQAGNSAVFTGYEVVTVNLSQRSNVQVQDVKADPTTVEDGATTTITVTVKHVGGYITASNVELVVMAIRGTNKVYVSVTPEWFAADGTTASNDDIYKDQTKIAKFTYNVGGQLGKVRIEVRAQADTEPRVWVEESGKSVTVTVEEAGWRAMATGVVFAVLLLGLGLGLATLVLAQTKKPPRADGGEPPVEKAEGGITSRPEPGRPEPSDHSPGPP